VPTETDPPSIRLYPSFPDDWEKLPPGVREQLVAFLERLQRNPYDPELQVSSDAHPPFFARRIAPGYVVYWTLKFPDLGASELSAPTSIDVLEIGKVAESEATPGHPSGD
jgi:mRNA-degrading endonuclease RelE of RelBE toxin-antitoxin system